MLLVSLSKWFYTAEKQAQCFLDGSRKVIVLKNYNDQFQNDSNVKKQVFIMGKNVLSHNTNE